MKENRMLFVSITILALSVLFSGFWIGYAIRCSGKSADSFTVDNKALMTMEETCCYLNFTEEQFNDILSYDKKHKEGLTAYNTYEFIPYIEIDGTKYFSKEQIDKWIEYNVINNKEIHTGS